MNKQDIEQKVTDSIIAALESGVAPWTKPWNGGTEPVSLSTGRAYRGINWLVLTAVGEARGYTSPVWMTYKQAAAHGGQVRKGEKGTSIVFWKMMDKKDDAGDDVKVPLLRYYTVFNAEQVDDLVLPDKFTPQPCDGDEVRTMQSVLDDVNAVWDATGNSRPTLTFAGARAFYRPSEDSITLPPMDTFRDVAGFASTLLHEAAHSTGHADRLDRWDGKSHQFGCADYAEEELVAEIGAAMLATRLGLPLQVEQSAAYVGSWLARLRDDRSLIISAAQRAQKAVDWVCGDVVREPVAV